MNQKAFTLVEVLAVIGLAVIMAGILILRGDSGQVEIRLQEDVSAVKKNIVNAREMAMSGVGAEDGYFGIGVYFDDATNDRFIVYKNQTANNMQYDAGDEILETVYLKGSTILSDYINVIFCPPDPIVCVGHSSLYCDSYYEIALNTESFVDLQLLTPDGMTLRTITIYNTGNVVVN